MSVLDKLRAKTNPVARRRHVSAARSWVTYSPERSKAVILIVELVLAFAVIGGVVQAVVWVQNSRFRAEQAQYEQSLVTTPTPGAVLAQPLVPDPASTTPPVVGSGPPADPTAQALARKWVTVWLGGRTAASQKVWVAQFRPMLLPSLVPSYAVANRSLIPKAGIRSLTSVTQGGKAYATVTLTNGLTTLVVMEGGPGKWLVDEFTDVQAD